MSEPTPTAASTYEQLSAHCAHRRLTRVSQLLPSLVEQAAQQELSYRDFLTGGLAAEVEAKREKHHTMRV